MTVVGVMPPHFSFPTARLEYWRPVRLPEPAADDFRPQTGVIVEMRPGVTTAQVQAFLDVVSQRDAKEDPRRADSAMKCRDLQLTPKPMGSIP